MKNTADLASSKIDTVRHPDAKLFDVMMRVEGDDWTLIPRLHDQAHIKQLEHTSCTCYLNTLAYGCLMFAWCLLDRVNGV